MKKQLVVTRPVIASRLMSEGIMPSQTTPNPWKPEYTMWQFPRSEAAEAIVAAFYDGSEVAND